MRLAIFEHDGVRRTGFLDGDAVVPLGGALKGEADGFTALQQAIAHRADAPQSKALALSDIRLLPPVARPGKIMGIGRNYGEHVAEGGLEPQDNPRIFFKPVGAISGPGDTVRRPPGIRKFDFEGELVVVIGKTLKRASREAAAEAIFGYMVGNDLSARELQFDVKPPQTSLAKGMDGFAATGPCVLTADEVGPAPDLSIRTWVSGRLMQQDTTGSLIHSIVDSLAYLSTYMTLHPGDLLFTGTPSGVGAFRQPPRYLEPGDTVTVEIERIGALLTHIGA